MRSTPRKASCKAFDKLAEVKPNVRLWYRDEAQFEQALKSGEIPMGQYYHDVTGLAAADGHPVRSTFPKEGGIQDSGNWVLSRASTKVEEAHVFIDYMSQPAIQGLMSRKVGTAPTLKKEVLDLTPEEFAAVSSDIEPIIPRYDLYTTKSDWLNQKWTELIVGLSGVCPSPARGQLLPEGREESSGTAAAPLRLRGWQRDEAARPMPQVRRNDRGDASCPAWPLKDVTKQFGDFKAVDNVNLTVPHGTFVCLLGPSGCGKTTLLRMIAGLEEPTGGAILLDGEDITPVPTHKRNLGMVFQSLALFPHLSVGDNIAYPLRIRGASQGRAEEARRRAAEAGPSARLCRPARSPSSPAASASAWPSPGRWRISPKLFLLDEPLSALDAKLREAMQVELRQLQQRLGITTIVVTHDQREAMTMADLVVVMGEGKIRQAASPIEIYRKPADAFVADFIGSTNLLDVSGRQRRPRLDPRPGHSRAVAAGRHVPRRRCRSGRRTCISARPAAARSPAR